ncbi:hypothetical protein F5146DRAFT_1142552 [Armillaria mellea]|nr:hypothetical protein F5146DRAFT_1142552 [Armillaria mellea]
MPPVVLRVLPGKGSSDNRRNNIADTTHHRHFLIASIYHVHPRSLHLSAGKAACGARFEEAWKVIKKELLDHIMPKDVIGCYKMKQAESQHTHLPKGFRVRLEHRARTFYPPFLPFLPFSPVQSQLQVCFLVSDRHCGTLPAQEAFPHADTLDFFLKTMIQTMRELIELIAVPEDEVDLSNFSPKIHSLIVTYKIAYYLFYLPIALAMEVSHTPKFYPSGNNETVEPYALAKSILIYFGEIQDDYLAFSGPSEQIGLDILDKKSPRCVNTALVVYTPEQWRVLDENYGRKDSKCDRRVNVVFESTEVDLSKKYGAYDEKVFGELVAMIGDFGG